MMNVPNRVKIKDFPLEAKVLMRLVHLWEKQQTRGDIKVIAKELKAPFGDVVKTVTALALLHQVIEFHALSINEFDFRVVGDITKWKLPASSFEKHLKAQERKGPAGPPPHLAPITAEQRAAFLEKAAKIGEILKADYVTDKIANCITRIGEEEVNKIVESVVDRRRNATPEDPSSVRLFFETYSIRRDQLFPRPK